MKTEDLIEALAAGTEPVKARGLEGRLALWSVAAAAVALVGVLIGLGVRPDLAEAVTGATFWMKAGYTLALALAGGWLLSMLGRPGAPIGRGVAAVLTVFGLALVLAAVNVVTTPADARTPLWMGHSWRVCTLNIAGLSLLTTPFLLWSARRFAPTRPMLAGAAAGMTAGAIAATLYGLFCMESQAAFVATWYTLGVLAAAVIGAVAGRFLLRW